MHFPILNDEINLIQPIGQPFFFEILFKKNNFCIIEFLVKTNI